MNELRRDDSNYVWHPFSSLSSEPPLMVKSAKGIYLETDDNRKIIDGISSWWVNTHGHSHSEIAKAMYDQALTLEHVIFAGFTHEPAIRLAREVLALLPDNQRKVFFSDNGSTAVEVGIKMAIQYWHNVGRSKRRIIAIEGAYHGDTFGAMSVGDRGIFTAPFAQHLFDVEFLPWPDGNNDTAVLEKFDDIAKSDDVAAFVFEPLVQGAGGMRMYSARLLQQLLEIARKHHVITIADEVFTGFGRTGRNFASDHIDAKPDIFALSKALTGGTIAMGITTCSETISDAFQSAEVSKTFFHGHSFTANPVACAAALKSIELLKKESCQERIGSIEKLQREFVTRNIKRKSVRNLASLGIILSMEVVTQQTTSYTNPVKKIIYNHFLERNILLRPLGNVLYFLPSYAFADDDIKMVHQEIESFLALIEAGL